MFRNLTIHQKLVRLAMTASAAAVLLALTATSFNAWSTGRERLVERTQAVARILAQNVAAAVVFDNREEARKTLEGLRASREILSAVVYDPQGKAFTHWEPAGPRLEPPEPLITPGFRFLADGLVLTEAIDVEHERVGTLSLHVNLAAVQAFVIDQLRIGVLVMLAALVLAYLVTRRLQRTITGPLSHLVAVTEQVSQRHDYSLRATRLTNDEVGGLVESFNQMLARVETHAREVRDAKDALEARVQERTEDLLAANRALERETARRTTEALVSEAMRGDLDARALGDAVLATLAQRLGAEVGVLYLREEDRLVRVSVRAAPSSPGPPAHVAVGEGLVGQAAADHQARRLDDLVPDWLRLQSATASAATASVLVLPFHQDGDVVGVLELAARTPFPPDALETLAGVAKSVAVSFSVSRAREKVERLLDDTQRQAAELQAQQEELRTANAELEASELRLQQQQEALRATNEELAAQSRALEGERAALAESNQRLEEVRAELETKARDLADASRYKSEFLANMSHELRTPLNSILILARLLAENREANLSAKQVEFCESIGRSGTELLTLINEILDLAKVEAGRMEITLDATPLAAFAEEIRLAFDHVAHNKGLDLVIEVAPDTPTQIVTDRQRLGQIIRNLLSNAFKFTEKGRVEVRMARGPHASEVAISVSDTGIGIPEDRRALIFEAFRQADGSTSRTYGGTGLGLSIARDMAGLLGGRLTVESEVGRGSTFTLLLPVEGPSLQLVTPVVRATEVSPAMARAPSVPPPPQRADDPLAVPSGDPLLLVIEDDPTFAGILVDLAHERGFKCIVAPNGEAGLELARHENPQGIVLDVRLPGMDGWTVMERLRADPATRDIPVHFVTVAEDRGAFALGAVGFLSKPVTRPQLEKAIGFLADRARTVERRVLVVAESEEVRQEILENLSHETVKVEHVSKGREAIERLAHNRYDCAIIDLGLADVRALDLLTELRGAPTGRVPPLVLYSSRTLSPEELRESQRAAASVVLRGPQAPERLAEEVRLFLHRLGRPGRSLTPAPGLEMGLAGHKVLLVDDDVRNLYALTELLESQGLRVVAAENGREALDLLDGGLKVDAILMDMMMPHMDGYEAIREVRKRPAFAEMPIIALTAKAMKGDRERCLEAGANEYIPKPVDAMRLLSALRVWLRVSQR